LTKTFREKAESRPIKALELEQRCRELELDAQRLKDDAAEPPDNTTTRALKLVNHELNLVREKATLTSERADKVIRLLEFSTSINQYGYPSHSRYWSSPDDEETLLPRSNSAAAAGPLHRQTGPIRR
jgi:hypothetical protein